MRLGTLNTTLQIHTDGFLFVWTVLLSIRSEWKHGVFFHYYCANCAYLIEYLPVP